MCAEIFGFVTEENIRRIMNLYDDGKPLCCAEGRRKLRGFMGRHWADCISDFAYETLGCNGDWRPGGTHFANGRRKLNKFLETMVLFSEESP